MAAISQADVLSVEAKAKTLINAQLKQVLRRQSLAVSGNKAELQKRIIQQIKAYEQAGDLERFSRLRTLVNNPDSSITPSPATPRTVQGSAPTSSTHQNHHPYNMPNGAARPSAPLVAAMPPHSYGTARPNFRESPFYTILEPLTSVMETKASVRETTRDQVDCKIILRGDVADRLLRDPTIRVMIYCASDPLSPFSKTEISFPYQVEIKVNMDEVKTNLLRGLKNKPGSTRPADITDLLRKRGGYENTMTVTYALTTKRFYLVVNVVRQHPVEELVDKLKSGKGISKEQVIREMVSKVQDSDIEATSSTVSLKCPISTLRIDVPCRSTVCGHNQCFDASSFLQLQEQAPTWTCPVCYKIVNFEALTVDQYVDNILKRTPKSVDQVIVEPTGEWSQTSEAGSSSRPNGTHASSDDEDLVEIKDMPRVAAVKSEAAGSSIRTPPTSSREQSASSAPPPSAGDKRPRGQVIDLTFSSDEDDQPPRAPKRQLTNPSLATLSSFPSSENFRLRPNGIAAGDPNYAQTNPLGRPSFYTYPS